MLDEASCDGRPLHRTETGACLRATLAWGSVNCAVHELLSRGARRTSVLEAAAIFVLGIPYPELYSAIAFLFSCPSHVRRNVSFSSNLS